jgi:hypothetical protein
MRSGSSTVVATTVESLTLSGETAAPIGHEGDHPVQARKAGSSSRPTPTKAEERADKEGHRKPRPPAWARVRTH